MPFQSQKQRRYMHANLPEIANRWERDYAGGGLIPAHEAGIYGLADGGQLVQPGSGRPGYGGPQDWGEEESGTGAYSGADEPSWSGEGSDTKTIAPREGPDPQGDWEIKTKTIKPPDEDKDWVNPTLDKIDAGLKLKNFATSLNPVDLLKVNPLLLGGSFLYNKFKNKKGDTTSLNFGTGLEDDKKVLGDTDFSDIQDYRAEVTRAQYNTLKSLGQVGSGLKATPANIQSVIGTVDPAGMGTFDSIKPSEWKEIFQGKKFKDIKQVAAEGGIVGLANGGGVAEAQAEQMLKMEYQKYRNQGGTMSYQQFKMAVLKQAQGQGPMAQEHLQRAAQGGRIGYQRGGPPGGGDPGMRGTGQSYGSSYGPGRDTGWSPGVGGTQHIPTHRPTQPTPDRFTDGGIRDINPEINRPLTDNERYKQLINIKTNWGSFLPGGKPYRYNAAQPIDTNIYGDEYYTDTMEKVTPSTFDKYTSNLSGNPMTWLGVGMSGKGQPLSLRNTGEILSGHANTINEQAKLLGFDGAEGGRVGRAEGGIMDLGGMEKDYRQEGGFVPLGKEEKADDVPARLSKNEFVFTADAVKAAGGGDIDAGAEVMQNMMNNLEEGGEISEESQGAQGMYDQQQMLQSRMA